MIEKQTAHMKVEAFGNTLVYWFHLFGLFVLGATTIWAAAFEFLHIIKLGHPTLKDLLLLFIYLEIGAMIGVYFQTHRLPVRYLIYITITALTRYLAVDVKELDKYTLLALAGCITLLTISILILKFSSAKYPTPKDTD